ncbi:LOW QUALITY PROTEIN: vitamin K-dependent protein S [Rhineura floridana]|uniref:LOW QUALITY PROTEIN: vitamin K-dependent protein S n=1 Tax=Rhineura floridana TaxID=261503 RepID=UPI002AC86EE5|nr:LOW QUALITY PROTEIN: vitamin K-dependent protein S [Rhineura floridana]
MRLYCMACLFISCLFISAIVLSEGRTFLSQHHASEFLVRKRRANSFMEESKKGNLERECIEEYCNKEEAREIFENNPETEYFYPLYLDCLASFRTGIIRVPSLTSEFPADLRSCVKGIPNQCIPLPCNEDGYKECIDGQAKFTCVCKPGWQGEKCEEDINECEDLLNRNGGCSQTCINFPGSYRCHCEDGYYIQPNKLDCKDRNECMLDPNICGTAQCKNTPGKYECECPAGYAYNSTTKKCEDVDECAENACSQMCVNSLGSYTCYCDGKKGFKLSKDMRTCEVVQNCLTLNLEKNYELLYLAEQFSGIPVLYLRFRLPEVTRFSAEFDFRTYDNEGVILYAESPDSTAWFLLALRDGKIEIQFKNELGTKVTSGGKAINDGLWHMISVEELEQSISVKIAKEAVMNINSPRNLFKPSNGFLETKVYIAGLPRKVDNTLIKLINPRLDGCIRAWNLLNQGSSGVKDIIQQKESKHCLISVVKGSYYPGTGMAKFHINYNNSLSSTEDWLINVTMAIRPSTGTGVLLALVSGETVPLALSIDDSSSTDKQDIIASIENVIVARLESKQLCTSRRMLLGLRVTRQQLELTADSQSEITYMGQQLSALDQAMNGSVDTYLGGIPDVSVEATPVTLFYNGCMEVKISDRQLDLDEAISKKNDIRSHSCPLLMDEIHNSETTDSHLFINLSRENPDCCAQNE